jgi:hypothetical protein
MSGNVRNFEFKIELDFHEDDKPYMPLSRHVNMFRDMKEKIEGNFKEPEAVG